MRGGRIGAAIVCLWLAIGSAGAQERREIPLDGTWQVAEGSLEAPGAFDRQAPVPGLADMAQPAFSDVGTTASTRQAFWYRRTFTVEGPLPPVAILKIHKARYGTHIWLNQQDLGEYLPCFTPANFDVRKALKGGSAENELVVRVGAFRTSVPNTMPDGWDFEKTRYIPGIYDSVELLLTGAPYIRNVQVVPNVLSGSVRVTAAIVNDGPAFKGPIAFDVREAKSGQAVATAEAADFALERGQSGVADATIPIAQARLWSPEDPFLYTVAVRTGAYTKQVRFGMRSLSFDPKSGRAILNGKPYFLRGTNVTLYRFFEDSARGDRPWRVEWVRRLHERFKAMHWNSIRYCIGLAPEFWYDLCDEMGIMIQDEFPIWYLNKWPETLRAEEIARQYADWMQERWNHPCVIIWDAQNESVTPETGKAIEAVRKLDLSGRPWENGWSPAQAPADPVESHPYLFSNPNFRLHMLAGRTGEPNVRKGQEGRAIIINEYGWLWLNRDGTPTTLTRKYYDPVLGPDATPDQRFYHYARHLAALTEFWRTHRKAAGVLHFCGLGYSRPDGQTSDHFIDLEGLKFEKYFDEFVRDAFNPVGLMIDFWAEDLPGGEARAFPVILINDLYEIWKGPVTLRIVRARAAGGVQGADVLAEQTQEMVLEPLGDTRTTFTLAVPKAPGEYRIVASLAQGGRTIRSLRDFAVLTPEQKQARTGLAVRRPVKASSAVTVDGQTYPPEHAVDGDPATRWSSEFADPQWLAVDLGEPIRISRVELAWEAAFAKTYTIDVSLDGQEWKTVYRTESGDGGTDRIAFEPTPARWVRLSGAQRATPYGYSLWEMRVFP